MIIAAPLWLLVSLLAAAGIGWTAWRNGWGSRRAVVAAAAGGLCAAAPAGIALRSAAGPVRIVAVDDSGSMRGAGAEQARAMADRLGAGGARTGVVRFAESAAVERTPSAAPLVFGAEVDRTAGRSDAAAALRRAAELLPRAGGEVVLITDGRMPPRDLPAVAAAGRALRARGGRLSVIPAGSHGGADAAAWSLRGPAHAATEAVIRLALTVKLSATGRARIRLERDGTVVRTAALEGRPGELRRIVVDDQPGGAAGVVRYRLLASAGATADEPDAVPRNGSREWLVTVGDARVVWLCAAEAPDRAVERLAPAARAAGVTLRAQPPEAMPRDATRYAGVAAVVVWDGGPARFPPGALEALAEYVAGGGGLLQLGGPGSFGLGGFGGDPLERVSAVKSDPRTERPLALALVLDASGSMAEPVSTADPAAGAKMDAARGAVESALEQLRAGDRLYIVPFREGPLTPIALGAGAAPGAADVLRSALTARGGTHVRPAVEQAAKWLTAATEPARQLVIISDGRDPKLHAAGIDRPALRALLTKLADAEIGASLLTSAQGSSLEELISAQGGRVARLLNFSGVEALLGRELRLSRGSLEWSGDAAPERVSPLPSLPLPERLPAVRRANRTALNDGAMVLLRLPGAEPAPLLAVRETGLGRSAAFTSLPAPPWMEPAAAPSYGGVVASALGWVLAGDRAGDTALRATAAVDHVAVEARWIGAAPADGRLLDLLDGDVRLPLEPVAPGRYRTLAALQAEARLATLVERRDGTDRTLGRIALPGGWAAEWSGCGVDLDGCHRLARAAGGTAVDDAVLWRPLPLPGEAPRPLGGWLLGAGLLLLVALFGKRRG
ncbi:MAG: vWA domain-containing protein [Planctomycetota bacterium]